MFITERNRFNAKYVVRFSHGKIEPFISSLLKRHSHIPSGEKWFLCGERFAQKRTHANHASTWPFVEVTENVSEHHRPLSAAALFPVYLMEVCECILDRSFIQKVCLTSHHRTNNWTKFMNTSTKYLRRPHICIQLTKACESRHDILILLQTSIPLMQEKAHGLSHLMFSFHCIVHTVKSLI